MDCYIIGCSTSIRRDNGTAKVQKVEPSSRTSSLKTADGTTTTKRCVAIDAMLLTSHIEGRRVSQFQFRKSAPLSKERKTVKEQVTECDTTQRR